MLATWESNETNQLKNEEVVLRATLAQRPQRLPPPLPSSPPPPVNKLLKPKNAIPKASSSSSSASTIEDSSSSDEGRPSTSSENETDDQEWDMCDSLKPLKFQRSSPPREVAECQIHQMPYHVLKKVFSKLDIHERASVSQVCRRWYNILTDGKAPLENVAVFNIFQKTIWETSVNRNAGSTVQCIRVPDLEALTGVLLHVAKPSSIKIWYDSTKFAKLVLEKIAEGGVKTNCVDIFPYSDEVGIEIFYELLPTLPAIIMRPHGTKNFWTGLDIHYFPKFEKLHTLVMDSFNLRGDLELPKNITNFEFQNRRDGSFFEILPKLSKLNKLEYLHVGHADFQIGWESFIETIQHDRMPFLTNLTLRFCRFGKESTVDTNHSFVPGDRGALKSLTFLKLDLCYGYMPRIIKNFLAMASSNLGIASINMLSDESYELFEQLYGDISDWLKVKNISLHLGLLEKGDKKIAKKAGEEESQPEYKPPSHAFQMIVKQMESSFCDDFPLLKSLFVSSTYPFLSELKFIQCPAVSNEILHAIAAECPRLKKFTLLSCSNADVVGMLAFVQHFNARKSEVLEIIWKRDIHRFSRPAAFYLELTRSENQSLREGLNHKFIIQSPADQNSGESIIIKSNENPKKKLIIQDFDHRDTQRILGAVLPFEDDEIAAAQKAKDDEIAAAEKALLNEEAVAAEAKAMADYLESVEEHPPSYPPPPPPMSSSPINKPYYEIALTTSEPSSPKSTTSSSSFANIASSSTSSSDDNDHVL